MANNDLNYYFENFSKSAFRFEALPSYKVEGSGEEEVIQSYIMGEKSPPESAQKWLDGLSQWKAFLHQAKLSGKEVTRLRLIPSPLTDYFKCEVDWGYSSSCESGEDIYLISQESLATIVRGLNTDFWLFDNKFCLFMNYDNQGRFIGTRLVDTVPENVIKLVSSFSAHSVTLNEYVSDCAKKP